MLVIRARWIVGLAVGYLAIPFIIFLIGWLQPLAADALCVLLIGIIVALLFRPTEDSAGVSFTKKQVGWTLFFSVVLLLFSGAGGIGNGQWDWVKHDAMLKELTTHSWPVAFNYNNETQSLVYYFSYYLPAALFGKVFGAGIAGPVLWVWTLIGFSISLLLLKQSTKASWTHALLAFFFAAGMEFLGAAIKGNNPVSPDYIQRHGWLFSQFTPVPMQLYWVPHQAIAIWICTFLLISAHREKCSIELSLLALGFLPMWSPLGFIGLLPVAAVILYLARKAERVSAGYLSLGVLSALITTLISVIFLKSVDSNIPKAFLFATHPAKVIISLGIFFLFRHLPLMWMGHTAWNEVKNRPVFLASATVLALVPLYQIGNNFELTMRGSIGPLAILALFIGESMPTVIASTQKVQRMAWITVFTIGALAPSVEIYWQVVHFKFDPTRITRSRSLITDLPKADREQYLGRLKPGLFKAPKEVIQIPESVTHR